MNNWKDRYDIDDKFGKQLVREIVVGLFIIALIVSLVVCTATATVGGY